MGVNRVNALARPEEARLVWGQQSVASNAEVINEGSACYYQSLSVDELCTQIRYMLGGIEHGLGRVNAEMRDHLLPALEVLKRRLPHGQYEKFLTEIKLNPATVRSWRARRKVAETTLLALLGEPEARQTPRKKREFEESAAQRLAEAGKRLATVVRQKKWDYAIKLATDYLEAWEDAR